VPEPSPYSTDVRSRYSWACTAACTIKEQLSWHEGRVGPTTGCLLFVKQGRQLSLHSKGVGRCHGGIRPPVLGLAPLVGTSIMLHHGLCSRNACAPPALFRGPCWCSLLMFCARQLSCQVRLREALAQQARGFLDDEDDEGDLYSSRHPGLSWCFTFMVFFMVSGSPIVPFGGERPSWCLLHMALFVVSGQQGLTAHHAQEGVDVGGGRMMEGWMMTGAATVWLLPD